MLHDLTSCLRVTGPNRRVLHFRSILPIYARSSPLNSGLDLGLLSLLLLFLGLHGLRGGGAAQNGRCGIRRRRALGGIGFARLFLLGCGICRSVAAHRDLVDAKHLGNATIGGLRLQFLDALGELVALIPASSERRCIFLAPRFAPRRSQMVYTIGFGMRNSPDVLKSSRETRLRRRLSLPRPWSEGTRRSGLSTRRLMAALA